MRCTLGRLLALAGVLEQQRCEPVLPVGWFSRTVGLFFSLRCGIFFAVAGCVFSG